MCGRGDQSLTWEQINTLLRIDGSSPRSNLEPRYNIAPTTDVKIVRQVDGKRLLQSARWDLIPAWWKKPLKEKKFSTFNARVETLRETASYRTPWRKGQRCIAPMNFYEWKRPRTKGEGPFHIYPKHDPALLLAGVWDEWKDPDTGKAVLTFSIVTVPANELIEPLHDRMPAILSKQQADDWFNAPPEEAFLMLKPCPSEWLSLTRVSPYVNNSRNQGPDCIKPEEVQ
ncbi:MAG: SOS response-associated peptidase [Pseudomonadota bacterium]